MVHQKLSAPASISLFVKDIWIYEEEKRSNEVHLPFFADGYPGLLFQQTQTGLMIRPHGKLMPISFLYGQTIHPIEMQLTGPYLLIIFRLYPFVFKSFFDVDPKSINDGCYDLSLFKEVDMLSFNNQMLAYQSVEAKIEAITKLLCSLFERKKQKLDLKIKQAIERIIQTNGQESINTIASALYIHDRTLERRFIKETGLSPKQFARIIQFQASLSQLALKDFSKINEVVYANGFADQSHFIRVFKAFTGETPRVFSQRM
ncbi:AraC family transcriptional regulator [Olivibacter sp. CPCC 100613]|uniref:helix-turn-helix transcriptional regulator n=1 Tax=Olivibacter sp. CPCC 100613 TaxID=3079931 RepID=UPI002FF65132